MTTCIRCSECKFWSEREHNFGECSNKEVEEKIDIDYEQDCPAVMTLNFIETHRKFGCIEGRLK